MTLVTGVAIVREIERKKKTKVKQLAEQFELSERTVYRFLTEASCYFPIYTKSGPSGGVFWMNDEKGEQHETD